MGCYLFGQSGFSPVYFVIIISMAKVEWQMDNLVQRDMEDDMLTEFIGIQVEVGCKLMLDYLLQAN